MFSLKNLIGLSAASARSPSDRTAQFAMHEDRPFEVCRSEMQLPTAETPAPFMLAPRGLRTCPSVSLALGIVAAITTCLTAVQTTVACPDAGNVDYSGRNHMEATLLFSTKYLPNQNPTSHVNEKFSL